MGSRSSRMNSYRMRFSLAGEWYELVVSAASTGSAIRYIRASHADASEITVVGHAA